MNTDNSRSNTMNLAMEIYDIFRDDENRAKRLAELFDYIELRFQRFQPRDEAVKTSDLEKTKFEITLEIEKTRSEIEKTRRDLSLEIERSRTDLMKYMNKQTIWTISAMAIIIGALKTLDWVLK